MSTEENKALVRRAYEAFNNGMAGMAALEELYAPDYVYHGPSVFGDMDLAAMKQLMPALWTAFPDEHSVSEDVIAEGDEVVFRWTMRATHRGSSCAFHLRGSKSVGQG